MGPRSAPHIGKISRGGGYLFRRTTQNNVLHAGVDIGVKAGTIVYAPADGTIVAVQPNNKSPFKGYGPASVVMRDDDGLYHLLAHMDPVGLLFPDPRDPDKLYKPVDGARVRQGDALGLVSTLNHTHWEVRRKFLKGDPLDDAKVRANTVDPLAWVKGSTRRTELPSVFIRPWAPEPWAPATTTSGGDEWIVLILLILLND
jgi:murein DD-endopeptidase MepM/ murein hydrolase activator NlpD